MSYTLAEEDYLKAIYHIALDTKEKVSTSAIATMLNTKAASVTDMLRKLSEKELIHYQKYKGVSLTTKGQKEATLLVRKHRLWEVFLVEKLGYTWDTVHDLAEQLEHIKSDDLIDRLDHFLGSPHFDPHGDPIPDAEGVLRMREQVLINTLPKGAKVTIVGVRDHTPEFLQYLDQMGLSLGAKFTILNCFPFDGSLLLSDNKGLEKTISGRAAQCIFVQTIR
jgi:DtxR family transcriptional regulator, Mn-dependent transcriptional regulator